MQPTIYCKVLTGANVVMEDLLRRSRRRDVYYKSLETFYSVFRITSLCILKHSVA